MITSPSSSGSPAIRGAGSPSRMAKASTSVGRFFPRKVRLSSWMAGSSTSARLSSTAPRSRAASIFWARRARVRGSTPAKGPPRVVTWTSASALRDLLGILEEPREPDVGEGVLEQLQDDAEGDRRDVGADEGRLHEVHRMTHASGEDLRLDVV